MINGKRTGSPVSPCFFAGEISQVSDATFSSEWSRSGW